VIPARHTRSAPESRTVARRRPGRLAAALALAALALAGCGEGGLLGGLRTTGAVSQPDEFMVLPTRPLEMPPNLAALPAPVPGATNRVAYRPRADAMAALSGRPAAEGAAAPGLVARVGRTDPAIRTTLAAEDAEFRRANRPRLLDRWFRRDRGRIVYESVTLDADAEWRRLRAAGLRVPAAPPIAP
jgi:hypothetical protein